MQPARKLPNPVAEALKERAIQEALVDIKGLVKFTINEDSPIAVTARYALSALYRAIHGEDVTSHQKQLILRSLVARQATSWIDLGELSEADTEALVLKNLWILEVPCL